MKLYFFLLVVLILSSSRPSHASTSPFITQINAAWSSRNYDKVFELANAESHAMPPDPEAFIVLYKYDLIVLGDNPQALARLGQLINVLQTVRPSAVAKVQEYRAKMLALAGSDVSKIIPTTTSELDRMHSLFPDELPAQGLLLLISAGD